MIIASTEINKIPTIISNLKHIHKVNVIMRQVFFISSMASITHIFFYFDFRGKLFRVRRGKGGNFLEKSTRS